ncbi:MAG: amino acid permease [Gemmatimonadetes bacterium]|nr:amino acid permease [Gemmatimonadota bacterium]MDA1103050.1 amino acid permease [Gemmatimonadota bacterium]
MSSQKGASASPGDGRSLGLWAATGIGVGAIVGGGVLALTGVAFATTGPSAVLAFGFNGVIAFLTALSFAELASRFPQSGGTYTYARRVLAIEAAFAVGWIVWFASVVAAVLYAMGFAVFLVPILEQLVRAVGLDPPMWLGGRMALLVYALGAVGLYAYHLVRAEAGGGQWATIGKVILFSVLILGGVWGFVTDPVPAGELARRFTPFFADGATGLVQAMGYTFIALQGFDLIAAVGGEVKQPEKNVPRAMFLSLAIAMVIYLPLLLLIVAVGSPTEPISALAARDPEIVVASAARSFLGAAGYWLVVVAGVLSMLSALQANLLAAAAVSRTMGADRTLPSIFEGTGEDGGGASVKLTAATIALVLVAVPDVAGAGAAASLIFLATFALAHSIAYLARRRASQPAPFQTRAFPLVPLVGGGSCLALGLYQALAVPSAGVLTALWLSVGAILYITRLSDGARTVDARAEGLDPQLIQLRGRTPLVLVPIANPQSAATLIKVAEAIAPKGVARVRLLTVVPTWTAQEGEELAPPLVDAQRVLGGALSAALSVDLRPEALITISDEPWAEIRRAALQSQCETILLGVGRLDRTILTGPLEELIASVRADVVILRAPPNWSPERAHKILVPARGGGVQSSIRARLLGSLGREGHREVTFLGVLPVALGAAQVRDSERALRRLARNEISGGGTALVVRSDDVVTELVARAADCDLMILGMQRTEGRRQVFGTHVLQVAEATECPLLMISQRA